MATIQGIKNSQAYSEAYNPDTAGTIFLDDGANESFSDDFGWAGGAEDLSNLQSNAKLTVVELHEQLQSLLEGLNPDQIAQHKTEIENLKKELYAMTSNAIVPSQVFQMFSALQGDILGTGEMGIEDGGGTISQRVADWKAKVENSENLDSETKKLLTGKLDDAANIESIDAEKAEEKLESVAQEVTNFLTYSPAAMRLSQELDLKDPGRVQEMLDKYGIDGSSANLDAAQIEKVLNDPLVTEAVAAEQEAYDSAYQTMVDMVPKQVKAAHEINKMTDQKDTSMVVDTDTAPFQWLYETQSGESKEAKTVLESADALAQKKAALLSALTGSEVRTNADEPGVIKLAAGTAFNALKNTQGSGKIIEWPEIEAVPFHADVEGDGQTAFPQWMKDAHYPHEATDTGGWNPLMLLGALAAGPALIPGGPAAMAALGAAGGAATAYTPDDPY